ncbi:MAG: T9SS type A sorting domain-containing protein [Flavobacteriales bacterium]|nr:T9SS type A sorting domain-containing protein [Flavobacteriales bacterium]
MKKIYALLLVLGLTYQSASAQYSVAHDWNETQLDCIRNYFAKPTVHARNLFHASVVMYDMWAVYDQSADTYFLGKTVGGYSCPFNGIPPVADVEAAREKAISYAMYRFLWNRYTIFAPPAKLATIQSLINNQMTLLGFDPAITSTDYSDGDPAKLGNYIAAKMEEFALGDGSNQANNYANVYYQPVNGDIWAQLPGAGQINDPNRWQELALDLQIDQNGNPVETAPPALSHEWGNVVPFAFTPDQHEFVSHDGHDYSLYLNQGPPPLLDPNVQTGIDDSFYKWGFLMVAHWHAFHNADDGVMIDLSPASTGGLGITDASQLPETFEEFKEFYNWEEGGDNSTGYDVNPVTGQPYTPQIVPRSDYSRVLAQFWADGPNSETPPGHWFTLTNYVANHPDFEKRWEGVGPILDDLEWDVKAYFCMGGAIHDAAVACWGHKGAYDYIRPISAIRWMCEQGQSTDPGLPNYNPAGVPLIPGFTELVMPGDPLAGIGNENLYKIKMWTWLGPVAATGEDGNGWKLGEEWWTYQTANFVTPPFSGYFSGHSTYSRSGAEALTLITGSEYFPGGMGEFVAPANTYLLADSGPSVEVKLQWASYRDASDQCSISRIYGGLHPPQDDIPGRRVGLVVGPQAFNKAETYFDADVPHATVTVNTSLVNDASTPAIITVHVTFSEQMDMNFTPVLSILGTVPNAASLEIFDETWLDETQYEWYYVAGDANTTYANAKFKVTMAKDIDGNIVIPAISSPVLFDTQNPTLGMSVAQSSVVNDGIATAGTFTVSIDFSEAMNTAVKPTIAYSSDDASGTMTYNQDNSTWSDNNTFVASFDVTDINESLSDVDLLVNNAQDAVGNIQVIGSVNNSFTIDTENPMATSTPDAGVLADADAGDDAFMVNIMFSEAMNQSVAPTISFPAEDGAAAGLTVGNIVWTDAFTASVSFDLMDVNANIADIDIEVSGATDVAGNVQETVVYTDVVTVDTENPVAAITSTSDWITDQSVGAAFEVDFNFGENMDTSIDPSISFPGEDPLANTLSQTDAQWIDNDTYRVTYEVTDAGEELGPISVSLTGAKDANGNDQNSYLNNDACNIDTRNPLVVTLLANTYVVNDSWVDEGFSITAIFDEAMMQSGTPDITFGTSMTGILGANGGEWINSTTYRADFDIIDTDAFIADIDVTFDGLNDTAGNPQEAMTYEGFFSVETGVGIAENDVFSGITLYPNPQIAGNDFTIHMQQPVDQLTIEVINSNGSVVERVLNNNQRRFITVSTENLAPGMYYVRLVSEEGQASLPLSIVR